MKPRKGIWRAAVAALLVAGVLVVKASALSITTVPISFPAITLDGADQTATTSNSTWQAIGEQDRGPFNITVASTDFTSAESKTISVSSFEIRLLDENIVTVSGPPSRQPTSTQTTFTPLSGTALKIATATGAESRGVFDLTPDFRLALPAEIYAGGYSATVTIAINTGP